MIGGLQLSAIFANISKHMHNSNRHIGCQFQSIPRKCNSTDAQKNTVCASLVDEDNEIINFLLLASLNF
jgi:hypothetical protein